MIGATLRIEGVDGSVWHVAGDGSYASPVQVEAGDFGDLLHAPVSTSYQQAAGVSGSRFQGMRYLPRQIVLRFTSFDQGSVEDWARIDNELRRAFSYEDEAQLVFETPQSGQRRLGVRLAEHPTYTQDTLPQYQRVARWQYALVAADPFWYGETLKDEFVFDGLNWTGGGVKVWNTGDVASWPSWVITAPAKFALPDVDLKHGDVEDPRMVWLPFQPIHHTVTVHTDPVMETIVDTRGTLLWAQMNGERFEHPIPAHTSEVTLPVKVDPLPTLPFAIPDFLRDFIAGEIGKWARALGQEEVFRRTPDDLAEEIRRVINSIPSGLIDTLTGGVIKDFAANVTGNLIRDAWGSMNNMSGATAQIRVPQRWMTPWGGE